MTFAKLSFKQKQLFRWCYGHDYRAVICDGAVRSGKTVCMIAAFILWAMHEFDGATFGICGKTVRSAERNIIIPLQSIADITAYFKLTYTRSVNLLTVEGNGRKNHFYVFGGKDESSYMLIQGITLSGVLFDEAALMPRSFVEQACARCSVTGSRLWFNCNPAGPTHWFYKTWILEADRRNCLRLHFTMEDNPSLSPQIRMRYERLYSGVFYRRYILGQWAQAEGRVYDFFEPEMIKPVPQGQFEKWYISCDYGTLNPFSAGLWCVSNGRAVRVAEYYYSGRGSSSMKTDEEYYQELEKLAGDRDIRHVVVDPSAASFIACIRRHGRFSVRKAKNDVLPGIRLTASMLHAGVIKIGVGCKDAIREFGLYRWEEKGEIDKPIKENDHAMDDIRYFCNTVMRRDFDARRIMGGMIDEED